MSAFDVVLGSLWGEDLLDSRSKIVGAPGEDLMCLLIRRDDGRTVSVTAMSPLYEVASLDVAGVYGDVATGYEVDDKLENVDAFLIAADKFVRNQFTERFFVSVTGRRTGSEIMFADSSGRYSKNSYSIRSSAGLRGFFRLFRI